MAHDHTEAVELSEVKRKRKRRGQFLLDQRLETQKHIVLKNVLVLIKKCSHSGTLTADVPPVSYNLNLQLNRTLKRLPQTSSPVPKTPRSKWAEQSGSSQRVTRKTAPPP